MQHATDEAQRRRALEWAIALTRDTRLAPQAYERDLLERYAQGQLSLEQVLQSLDTRVQHVLYRSRAVRPFTSNDLSQLLEESRAWNEAHGITGLLCYSEAGYFMQLIEGEAQHVQQLYARIQRDPRHTQVTTLSQEAEAQRHFPDWGMAFVAAERNEFHWVLMALETRNLRAVPPRLVHDPHLLTLLSAFCEAP